MAIAAASSARDVAAYEREAARQLAAAHTQRMAEERRDTRVQEAKEAAAQPSDQRSRQPPSERLVDVRV